MTGSPASSGRRRISTAAMNWSRSTCRTHGEGCVMAPSCRSAVSGDEQQLARRAAALQVVVGRRRVLERVAATDLELQRPRGQGPEDRGAALEELAAGGGVVHQG